MLADRPARLRLAMSAINKPAPSLVSIWLKRAHYGVMDAVPRATLRAGRGLVGNADQGGRRQVTVISAERWAELERELGMALDPSGRRANLLVSGVDLRESRDRVLVIGNCRVRIVGETRPCERMEDFATGLQPLMRERWGGGAYGEALDDGDIAVGDEVRWASEP
jgi:MOSC domain-containing protein YiiM